MKLYYIFFIILSQVFQNTGIIGISSSADCDFLNKDIRHGKEHYSNIIPKFFKDLKSCETGENDYSYVCCSLKFPSTTKKELFSEKINNVLKFDEESQRLNEIRFYRLKILNESESEKKENHAIKNKSLRIKRSSSSLPGHNRLNLEGCGRRLQTRNLHRRHLLIEGGNSVRKIDEWPWMAAIRRVSRGGQTLFVCGGSLITKKHVLTAAHCFGPNDITRLLSDYRVVLGSLKQDLLAPESAYNNAEKGIFTFTPSALDIHRGFQFSNHQDDIAVVTLDNYVTLNDQINTVCLPINKQRYDHGQVLVTGWGSVNSNDEESTDLEEVSFRIISNNRCRRYYRNKAKFRDAITNKIICAGDLTSDKDACKGDSGGPMVIDDEADGVYIQIGITAFGLNCAEKGYPGLYVRVKSYLPWIENVVSKSS